MPTIDEYVRDTALRVDSGIHDFAVDVGLEPATRDLAAHDIHLAVDGHEHALADEFHFDVARLLALAELPIAPFAAHESPAVGRTPGREVRVHRALQVRKRKHR